MRILMRESVAGQITYAAGDTPELPTVQAQTLIASGLATFQPTVYVPALSTINTSGTYYMVQAGETAPSGVAPSGIPASGLFNGHTLCAVVPCAGVPLS